MTVEDRRSMGRDGGAPRDQFPVGMRVLAVDDDPTCLRLLETLLLRCQYHVTTTNQAITALEMLRENQEKFDLVISDVHMPDMDGFRLLELVGLEMDLPVIMLSANSETQAVMKGITHGACDYLLKPVRIEELRNIWQHVVRRRKFDARDRNNSDDGEDCEKAQIANSEGRQGPVTSGVSDLNAKLSRKRKDQNEEDEDGFEENTPENEDASSQKKQRVVWSVELHRKFVAAVNHLGVDKAVPKKILDIMNVDMLTRENVASHLQKYRLYLKRLSAAATQQANMVAAFGGRHPSYLPMGALEGFRNVHSFVGSRQLQSLTSFQPNGGLRRMNNPTGFGQHGVVPSSTVQPSSLLNNSSNRVNDIRTIQGSLLGNPNGNFLQGMSVSPELDQLQQHKPVQEANSHFPGVLSGSGLAIGSASNSFANVTSSPLLLSANQEQKRVLGNHSSVRIPSLSPNSLHLPDLGRCNDTWQDSVPSKKYSTNTSSMAASPSHNNMSSSNILNDITPIISHMGSNLHRASSSTVAVAPLRGPVMGSAIQHQTSSLAGNTMLMPTGFDESTKFLSNSRQQWEDQQQAHTHNPNIIFNSSTSLPSLHNFDATDNLVPNNGPPNEKMDMAMTGQNSVTRFLTQDFRTDCQLNYKEDYTLETTKLHGGFTSNGCSLDDLVNSMMKPVRDDGNFLDDDLTSDIYPPQGTCVRTSSAYT